MPHNKKIIITSGYFNPVHSGHINLFREARKLGNFLVVIVNSDRQAKLKGSVEFMPEQERLEIISSIKYVDDVILSVDTTKSVAESLRLVAQKYPDAQLFFAKGGDRNAGNIPLEETNVCEQFNIKIINDVGGGKVQSSSWLIENVVNAFLQVKKLQNTQKTFSSMEVLGNKIDMVQISQVVDLMDFWITQEKNKTHWIVATGMHGVMESQKNKAFGAMLKSSDLWAPDSISIIWLARLNGFNLKRRVAGPDLFNVFLHRSLQKGYKHYFYGDTNETLSVLQKKLTTQLPGIKTEYFSPPFRELSPQEDAQILKKINDAKPDVLWVGLGLPKQEMWIFKHREKLQVPVIVGVGAAFKFQAGIVKRAPTWMQNIGLEWLHRLICEPKVVWRRVFLDMPLFVWLVLTDSLKKKLNK